MSIIIVTVVSNNITVLVHNVIFFGYLMPKSHDVNEKSPLSAFPFFLPLSVFARVGSFFTRNTLSAFLCSDHIIEKNNGFSK